MSGLRGKSLIPVAVTAAPDSKWDYGFYRPTANADLGHFAVGSGTPLKDIAFSPRNQKPARATKKTASGMETSFVDYAAYDTAKTAKYKIALPKASVFRSSQRAKAVCVKVSADVYYGWMMKLSDYTFLGDAYRTALGIEDIGTSNSAEVAVNANGFILKAQAAGISPGTYFGRNKLKVTFDRPGTDGFTSVTTYAKLDWDGTLPAAPANPPA